MNSFPHSQLGYLVESANEMATITARMMINELLARSWKGRKVV